MFKVQSLILNNYRFETYYSLVRNLYRRKSPLKFGERTEFISEEILKSDDLKKIFSLRNPNAIDEKIFVALAKAGNATLINLVYSFLGLTKRSLRKFS